MLPTIYVVEHDLTEWHAVAGRAIYVCRRKGYTFVCVRTMYAFQSQRLWTFYKRQVCTYDGPTKNNIYGTTSDHIKTLTSQQQYDNDDGRASKGDVNAH